MGGGHGKGWQRKSKGQGRGPPRSQKEIQRARSVNSWRWTERRQYLLIDCSKEGESLSLSRLAYTGCVLLYLSSCGITVKDCGGLNLAVSGNTVLEALPRLLFIDCLSWTEDAAVSSNYADHGLWQRLLEGGRRQNNASTRLPTIAQHTLST